MPKNYVIKISIDEKVADAHEIEAIAESFLSEAEFYFEEGSVVVETSVEECPDDGKA